MQRMWERADSIMVGVPFENDDIVFGHVPVTGDRALRLSTRFKPARKVRVGRKAGRFVAA